MEWWRRLGQRDFFAFSRGVLVVSSFSFFFFPRWRKWTLSRDTRGWLDSVSRGSCQSSRNVRRNVQSWPCLFFPSLDGSLVLPWLRSTRHQENVVLNGVIVIPEIMRRSYHRNTTGVRDQIGMTPTAAKHFHILKTPPTNFLLTLPPPLTSFDDMKLKPDLLRGVYAYGFERPSAIQERAIMPICTGRDVIAQAQSGTGKTATFTISILQRVSPGFVRDGRWKNRKLIMALFLYI